MFGTVPAMFTALTRALAEQDGLVLHSRILECGLTPSRIRALVRTEVLVLVRRGVYADGALWRSLDDFVGRPLLRVRAAALVLQRTWVLSHDSAALEMGMPLLDPRRSLVHVTRPGYAASWTRADIVRHYARYAPSRLRVSADGYRHLSMARTGADLARQHGEAAGVVAFDWALRQGVPRAELHEVAAEMSGWPGVTQVRSAVDLADPRAESAHESLSRRLLASLGLGEVDVQFPLQLTRQVAWCDLRVGNHVFEVVGRLKYVPRDRGGLTDKDPDQVLWDEKRRAREIREKRLGLSEIFYADHSGSEEAQAAARDRLRAEYAVTLERFGADLHPELAEAAARLRARHGRRDRASAEPA